MKNLTINGEQYDALLKLYILIGSGRIYYKKEEKKALKALNIPLLIQTTTINLAVLPSCDYFHKRLNDQGVSIEV